MLRETIACQPKFEQLSLNKKHLDVLTATEADTCGARCHHGPSQPIFHAARADVPVRLCVCGVEAWFALSPHIQTEIVNHTHSQCHTLPSLELKVYLQGRDSIKAADAFAKQTAVTVDPSTELDVVPIVPSDMDPNHAGVSHFEPLFKGHLVQPWTPSAFMESMVPMDSTR